jgi:hypothetical protein
VSPVSEQCRATSKTTGERCGRLVKPGELVCRWHGGRAPAVRAKAERRAELARVERAARRVVAARPAMSLPEVYEELLRTAAQAVEWRDRMQEAVDHLSDLRYKSVIGTEQIRGEVTLLEKAMGQVTKVLELIARLDLDSRVQNLTAGQAALVVEVIKRILYGLNLTPEQEALTSIVVPRELRRMAGDAA